MGQTTTAISAIALLIVSLLNPVFAQSWPRGVNESSSQVCASSLPPPSVRVTRKTTPLVYRYDLTASQISALNKVVSGQQNVHYLGLTETGLETSAIINAYTMSLNGGVQCMSPEVLVNVGFVKMTVYVAKELTNYRCAFDHVLSHELQHVEFHEEALRLTMEQLNTDAQDYLSRNSTLAYGSAKAADAYSRNLSNKLIARSKQLFVHYNTQHSSIDTVEEYARNSTVCAGIINRLMAQPTPGPSLKKNYDSARQQ